MAKSAKPTPIRPDSAYDKRRREAGDHVQLKTTLKRGEDVAMWKGLKARFPDASDGGLLKLALRELAKKSNR